MNVSPIKGDLSGKDAKELKQQILLEKERESKEKHTHDLLISIVEKDPIIERNINTMKEEIEELKIITREHSRGAEDINLDLQESKKEIERLEKTIKRNEDQNRKFQKQLQDEIKNFTLQVTQTTSELKASPRKTNLTPRDSNFDMNSISDLIKEQIRDYFKDFDFNLLTGNKNNIDSISPKISARSDKKTSVKDSVRANSIKENLNNPSPNINNLNLSSPTNNLKNLNSI